MGLEHRSRGLLPCLAMLVMALLFGSTKGDINEDKDKCGEQLVGLTSCLPYVGGETKAPTMECCNGLKLVLTKSMVCMCILIKDHNDPSLNLKINDTLALGLPDTCDQSANISDCVSLLHLQSGSQEAKIFEDYAKAMKNNNNTMPMTENSTSTSDGASRMRNEWMKLKIVGLLSIIVTLHFDLSNEIGSQSTI